MAGVDAWNRVLLDQLLPRLPDTYPDRTVLLACDDEIVRACGRALGIDSANAVSDLLAAVTSGYDITYGRGVTGLLSSAGNWAETDRAEIPPFLGGVCVTVLAASRMDLTEEHTAAAYYPQLTGLLGVPSREDWPHVHRFDEIPGLFGLIAEWLADVQDGERGVLRLPHDPRPRVIGMPISQTILRGRDRRLLGEFFLAHGPALAAGWSPVYLLGRWAGRAQLTQPARERIADPAIREMLNSVVLSAYRAWDGTRLTGDGKVVLRAGLRLGVRGAHAVLLAVSPDDRDRQLRDPSGDMFDLRGQPAETLLPWEWLAGAENTPLRLEDLNSAELVEVAPRGSVLLFEQVGAGFEQVPVARADPDGTVWALTCDPALLGLPVRRHPVLLPAGWAMLIDVPVGLLPSDLIAPEGPPDTGDTARVLLTGGLTLAGNPVVYLADEPPALTSRLDEPASVEIDGRDVGELRPGRTRQLDEIAGRAGDHSIVCGDLDTTITLAAEGLRQGVGGLVWDLSHRTLAQHGPIQPGHALSAGKPIVCGADVADGGLNVPGVMMPVIRQPGVSVTVLHAGGAVTHHQAPPADEWLRATGWVPEAWEVPDERDDAVWILIRARSPRVLNVRSTAITATDEALDAIEEFASAQLISSDAAVIGEWRGLVLRATA